MRGACVCVRWPFSVFCCRIYEFRAEKPNHIKCDYSSCSRPSQNLPTTRESFGRSSFSALWYVRISILRTRIQDAKFFAAGSANKWKRNECWRLNGEHKRRTQKSPSEKLVWFAKTSQDARACEQTANNKQMNKIYSYREMTKCRINGRHAMTQCNIEPFPAAHGSMGGQAWSKRETDKMKKKKKKCPAIYS